MTLDIQKICQHYAEIPEKIAQIRRRLNRPLTLTEKILYTHLSDPTQRQSLAAMTRGSSYVEFAPDRVAMQDATAQMALLQFMQAGKSQTAVPTTVHCDHLIMSRDDRTTDLENALNTNKEIYDFLSSVTKKYGIGFWGAGAGIIHQIVFENYAFPGGMMLGTDSHTPTAGGLGMAAIGVGGADAMDVMVGMPWELKLPKIMGIHLKGTLNPWASPKDVILKLAGILTVKGGTGAILEYFGEGASTISATGKSTICNMGAEVGATTSLFAYDKKMHAYLVATDRADVAHLADQIAEHLTADPEVYQAPDQYYDKIIEIDLTTLEPYINGPFTPDKAWPVSQMGAAAQENDYPIPISAGLIGSCTNSSYEDLARCASLIRQAQAANIAIQTPLFISPGSQKIYDTIALDGILDTFKSIGSTIFANACGPCIGQWERKEEFEKNTILTSFNRNFAKRNDGNPNTYAFVASPEMVTAFAISGTLNFNPITDFLINQNGDAVRLDPPVGAELPSTGFSTERIGFVPPSSDYAHIDVEISPNSDRLQVLPEFAPWNHQDFHRLALLIKVKGKCTTDHISMAGPWLKYRGHLDNISNNLLINAVNAFNDRPNSVKNQLTGQYDEVPNNARYYNQNKVASIIIGEENYGEGSSREHAAMEPRHLGVCAVIVKSFARIHESNLKKQGILALTFKNKDDYDKIQEDDRFDIQGLADWVPASQLTLVIHHINGTIETIPLLHTYNATQIAWFNAGSALNMLKSSL